MGMTSLVVATHCMNAAKNCRNPKYTRKHLSITISVPLCNSTNTILYRHTILSLHIRYKTPAFYVSFVRQTNLINFINPQHHLPMQQNSHTANSFTLKFLMKYYMCFAMCEMAE
jgi:hypothetical protein